MGGKSLLRDAVDDIKRRGKYTASKKGNEVTEPSGKVSEETPMNSAISLQKTFRKYDDPDENLNAGIFGNMGRDKKKKKGLFNENSGNGDSLG